MDAGAHPSRSVSFFTSLCAFITGALVALPAAQAQSDTTIVLGEATRDLTGDGRPETLRLVGTGPRFDSLNVTLTITRDGAVIYRMTMAPLTRQVGYSRSRRTTEQQRTLVSGYGAWFFGNDKFMTPQAFVDFLRRHAPGHLRDMPEVIARDGGFPTDTAMGAMLWREMQARSVTILQFSPGGDGIWAIGWSERTSRFYRLMECC